MALSDGGAQQAGHHAAGVEARHAAAPAIQAGSLTLHAGEAPEPTAACTAHKHINYDFTHI